MEIYRITGGLIIGKEEWVMMEHPSKKMKAAMLYGTNDLRVEMVDVPRIGPNEILAKVRVATTCGTDLKIFSRGYAKPIRYPTRFGHEWAGDIVEVGRKVTDFKEGMRITAILYTPCFKCEFCMSGKFNLCKDRQMNFGAYAEYIKIPERTVKFDTYEIPDDVTYGEAALAEPLASVIHGHKRMDIKPGDTVAIIGSGAIGLFHLQLAKLSGAEKVIVMDLTDERLKVARKLGAETFNSSRENPVEKVKELTDGSNANVVIEAVGLPETWELATKLVRNGGTVMEFGGAPPNTKISVSTELLHYGEVTLMGSYDRESFIDNKKALDLISSGLVDGKSIITKEMRLDEVPKAFEILTKTKEELKIAIVPS